MKVLNFVKLTLLSTALSQVSLFADIYKLEVTNDKQTIRFCVYNLTRNYSDWFSVKKVGSSYESGDGAIGGCIWDTQVDIGVGFNFGSFRANLDDKNNRLQLCGGCFADALLLEKTDYPIVVTNGSALQANTLVAKKAIFKNEGELETFVTILQDCPMVENKGKLHARNLFLHGTDIQNYGMVTYDDVFKAVGGKIIPKAANFDFHEKQGFFQHGASTGNTRILSLHKTYHGKTVVDKGRLQIKELTDGSFNIFNPFGSPWNYTAILVGHLDACGGMVVKSGTTLNFYPGSCFVVNAPVVIGSNVTLNLGCSDDPSWGNCSLDDTINVKSGSAANLNKPKGDHSKEGV